jgi:MFS family permease
MKRIVRLNMKSNVVQQDRVCVYGLLIFLLAACFYLYEFALQISPGVMTEALMHDLHIQGLGLGLLSSFYYYAYTPMQLPAGILMDRLGPRLLLTVMVAICAIGALVFSYSHHVMIAALGRLLMGGSSAFAFIGALVLITRWFPRRYFALLVGIAQFMGSLGAIVGEAPLAKAVATFGWRHAMFCLSVFGLALALMLWLVVRDWPNAKQAPVRAQTSVWQNLGQVLGKKQTWVTAAYAFLVWAPITVFAALWGIPFLVKAYNISATEAGSAVAMIWLGVAFGCPLLGWWSDSQGYRKPVMLFCALVGMVALSVLLYVPISLPVCYFTLLLFGIAAAGQSISFGVVSDNNSMQVVGTAIGFNNMAIVAGGAIFQPLVGWLLDYQSREHWLNNVPNYTLGNYKIALSILPICYILAAIICLGWLREPHKRLKSKA